MNVEQELVQLADPKRAEGEKKYLKSPLKHYGVTVPKLRKLARDWVTENKALTIQEVITHTDKLWDSVWHEERMVAIYILVYRVHDLTWKEFPVVEKMVRESTGWAQLDMIAAWLCGELFTKHQAKMIPVMRRWIHDNNFWVRRAAVLTLLGPIRKDTALISLFEELSVPLLAEKEFFIRKAIGWVLRELSKIDPDTVAGYVHTYGSRMSGLTYREAVCKLPEELRKNL